MRLPETTAVRHLICQRCGKETHRLERKNGTDDLWLCMTCAKIVKDQRETSDD